MNAFADRIWRFDWLSAAIASPFAVILAYLVTAALDRSPPVIYEDARPLSDSVPQGGTIEVQFTVFRLRTGCDTDVKRWLTDAQGVRHSIPSFTVGPRVQLAGLDTYRRSITLPAAVAAGQAEYEVDLTYQCNLLHHLGWPIRIRSPSIRFQVTPSEIILPPLVGSPANGD